VGTVWWFLLLIVYVKNGTDLANSTGQAVPPISWMWTGIYRGTGGWTAAAYLTSFVVGLVVSVAEFVAWIFYLTGEGEWFSWYTNSVGYYGSIIPQMFPILWAILQLGLPVSQGGLAGDNTAEFGYNAVFIIGVGLAVWIQAALLHVTFAPRLACYVAANPPESRVDEVKCPLKRIEGQSDEDYQAACAEIFKAQKDKGASAVPAEAADSDDAPAEEAVEKKEGEAW